MDRGGDRRSETAKKPKAAVLAGRAQKKFREASGSHSHGSIGRALATAISFHATENFTPQPLWTMPSEPNPRTSPTKPLLSFVVSASALKSTDFPQGCLGCWLQSATLRNRWRTLAVHPPAAEYARLTGHDCTCVHWTLKLCRKVTDTTRGLSCRRWRRRIVSSCREHRLNPMHRWKKPSAASIRYTTARHQLGLMVLIWRRQTDG